MIGGTEWEGMTKAQKLDRIEEEKQRRAQFQEVFSTVAGKEVYAWFANECGRFATDSQVIEPVLIGLMNRLDYEIGVIHPMNFFTYAQAQLSIANVDDLVALGKAEQAKEGT